MKHVIIGAGASGITAANTIRTKRKEDEIVVLSTDDAVYSRCMLHKFIAGSRSVQEMGFVPDDFFEASNIRWKPGVSVTGLNTNTKKVLTKTGEESYDKLLIACGSVSTIPPIPGLKEAESVVTLRDLPDAVKIRQKAHDANNIVIIGTGLVGLDAAYGLIEMGKKPTIVDIGKTIMATSLDARSAKWYQNEFEKAGCTFLMAASIKEIETSESSALLKLGDGQTLKADLLIVAAGVKPSIGFLGGSGIECKRGIVVDEHMSTNVDDVYAAGDVTAISESWPAARIQGDTAALNMCGITTTYDLEADRKNSAHFFGIPSISVGKLNADEGETELVREDKNRYQKLVLKDNVPVGIILLGDISRSGFWQYMIKNRIPVTAKNPWKTSFANSYSLDERGMYKWA